MVKLPSKLVEYLEEVVRSLNRVLDMETTPFAVHYEKMRIHLREKANNYVKIHLLTAKDDYLRVNQIQ